MPLSKFPAWFGRDVLKHRLACKKCISPYLDRDLKVRSKTHRHWLQFAYSHAWHSNLRHQNYIRKTYGRYKQKHTVPLFFRPEQARTLFLQGYRRCHLSGDVLKHGIHTAPDDRTPVIMRLSTNLPFRMAKNFDLGLANTPVRFPGTYKEMFRGTIQRYRVGGIDNCIIVGFRLYKELTSVENYIPLHDTETRKRRAEELKAWAEDQIIANRAAVRREDPALAEELEALRLKQLEEESARYRKFYLKARKRFKNIVI